MLQTENRTTATITHELNFFCSQNKADIAETQSNLIAATEAFLVKQGWRLPDGICKAAKDCIERGDMDLLSRLLRVEAVSFAKAGAEVSARYWALIDGLSFFADSIGDHWKYLGIEQRRRYLDWASDHAKDVIDALH